MIRGRVDIKQIMNIKSLVTAIRAKSNNGDFENFKR